METPFIVIGIGVVVIILMLAATRQGKVERQPASVAPDASRPETPSSLIVETAEPSPAPERPPAAPGAPTRVVEAGLADESSAHHGFDNLGPALDTPGASPRWLKLGLVAGFGAGAGLVLFGALRRRRRRDRVEELRSRARQSAAAAGDALSHARARASSLAEPIQDKLDSRATAGSLSLVAALAVFAALRRRQQEQRRKTEAQRLAAEAAAAAERARKRGLRRLVLSARGVTDRLDRAPSLRNAGRKLRAVAPNLAVAGGAAALAIITIIAARRALRPDDWSGYTFVESAPTRL